MDTTNQPASKKHRSFKWPVIIIVVLLLIGMRIVLPYIVLDFANDKLAKLDGYYGHIGDIDIALYRGAYVMKGVYIDKIEDDDKKQRTEFVQINRVDFSVEWSALFDRKIVAEVEFDRPVIKYTLNKTVGKKAEDDTTDFLQLVKSFVPLKINRFDVLDGEVHYVDPYSKPKVDVPVTELNIQGKGLTNESQPGELLPATIDATAKLFDGDISVDVNLDPLKKQPTFDLTAELKETNLVNFNPFFTAYANFDLKKGNVALYSEFAAKDGNFKGYVKPLIKDLDIVQFEKEEGSVLQIAYEAFIGSVAEIFQNQRKETLATRVEVQGKFSNPEVGILSAVLSVLKNAFIEALKPSVDNTVNIKNVNQKTERKFLDFFRKDEKIKEREMKKK